MIVGGDMCFFSHKLHRLQIGEIFCLRTCLNNFFKKKTIVIQFLPYF